jgi:DNA polymerase I
MPTAPDLVLVDGSSYLYRAFHALPPLANSRGEPTGAIYGVMNMMTKFMKDYAPQCIAIVFDASGRTFRDEIFAAYKEHRRPMPNDLRAQIEPLFELLKAQGYPVLRVDGVEADDVIGTLACRAAEAGRRVLISTSDKDMAQLVNESITLVNTMGNTTLDRAGVKAKFEVWPEQIVDYLALVGDTSDNIPGVEKVGPKTAAKWLNQYGSLDALIANASNVEGKVGENLRAGLATLELSRKLALIRTDLDLPNGFEECRPAPPDRVALREIYTRLELRSLLRQLEGEATADLLPATPSARAAAPLSTAAALAGPAEDPALLAAATELASIEKRYETLTEWAQLERWIGALSQAPLFAFDTETTSLDYMRAEIVGVSFCIEPGTSAYVPVRHDYAGAPQQLDRDRVLAALKPLLEDPERAKLGHHLKFGAHALANHGIRLAGMRYDTMLESYVWNSVASRHDLDSSALAYLGMRKITYDDVAGKGARQLAFNQVPVERAAEYCAEDSDVAVRLHRALWPRIERIPALQRLYEEFEQPLVPVLARMEERGVLLDCDKLRAHSREIAQHLQELVSQARKEAGYDFNLESPRQLQQVLFEKLQLPVLRKTPTGQPSTAEDVLEELAKTYALPRIVLDYRTLAKIKGTYSDKLPEMVNPRTGRVHTCYQQAVAQTGRLSSSDPNLQNIPIRSQEGRRIRQAFIAPEGFVLMAADYSQIELRIMAHLSGDEGLASAFARDQDVHQATAAEVFSVPLEEVTAEHRRVAKMINFGLIYGMSSFGLAQRLGLERAAAQQYVDRYFQRYPGVKRYMDETRRRAREEAFVETVYGRRLYLPDIRSRNKQLQQYAERAAINAPMQGTAADVIKRAMIAVDSWCERERVPARLIMQVHDELVLEVREDVVEHVSASVRERMAGAADLKVPLRVDIGVGSNWDDAH